MIYQSRRGSLIFGHAAMSRATRGDDLDSRHGTPGESVNPTALA